MSDKKEAKQLKEESLLRRAARYGVLLGIKESYLLGRNVLGLAVHPYKTLRQIRREEDVSQFLLVVGLPFYGLVAGVGGVLGLRWLVGVRGGLGMVAKVLLAGVGLGFVASLSYLGYWVMRVWRER